MDIPGGYFYSQDETSFVTGCVGFIGKLPLMVSFYEHSAVRICGRYGFFYSILRISTSLRRIFFVVILVLNGFLSQLLPLCVYFSAKLPGIDLCRLGDLFLLELLLVCAGFDVGAVNEYCTGVQHFVIQSFV